LHAPAPIQPPTTGDGEITGRHTLSERWKDLMAGVTPTSLVVAAGDLPPPPNRSDQSKSVIPSIVTIRKGDVIRWQQVSGKSTLEKANQFLATAQFTAQFSPPCHHHHHHHHQTLPLLSSIFCATPHPHLLFLSLFLFWCRPCTCRGIVQQIII